MLVKKGKGDKVAERGLSMVNLSSYFRYNTYFSIIEGTYFLIACTIHITIDT
jgi:hypothetical protein